MIKRRLLLNENQTKAGTIHTVSNLSTSVSITVDEYTELIIIESIAFGVSNPSILKIEGTSKKDIAIQNATSTNILILANTGGSNFFSIASGNNTILKKLSTMRVTKLYDFFWLIDAPTINQLVDTPDSYGSSIFDDYLLVYTNYTNKRLEYKRPNQHYNIKGVSVSSAPRFTYNNATTLYYWDSTNSTCDSIIDIYNPIPDFQEVLIYNNRASSVTLKHNATTGFSPQYGTFLFKDGVDFVLPAKSFIRLISLDNQFTNKIY